MWYLIEDMLEQPIIIKGILGLGWLSVILMVASAVSAALQ